MNSKLFWQFQSNHQFTNLNNAFAVSNKVLHSREREEKNNFLFAKWKLYPTIRGSILQNEITMLVKQLLSHSKSSKRGIRIKVNLIWLQYHCSSCSNYKLIHYIETSLWNIFALTNRTSQLTFIPLLYFLTKLKYRYPIYYNWNELFDYPTIPWSDLALCKKHKNKVRGKPKLPKSVTFLFSKV